MIINKEHTKNQALKELNHLEPKAPVKGLIKTQDEIDSLPKTFICEKHGEYKPRVGNGFCGRGMLYTSSCSKCVDEFNSLVDKRDIEIQAEMQVTIDKKKAEDRIEYLKNRGVGKRYINDSFENYITDTPEKKRAAMKCKSLCDDIINNKSTSNLIMVGGVGTGKTHLANSMVIELTDNKLSAVRMNLIDIIRWLKSTWSKDSEETEEDIISRLVKADLLIVDEVGMQFNSDTEKMFVFAIINGRYDECLPTVIISNLDVSGVTDVIGERCIDRLREDGGKVVAFDWESHR